MDAPMKWNVLDWIDTETEGRYDVTPLFANPQVYNAIIEDLCQPLLGLDIDFVMGIDALGFILGTSISHALQCGFVPLRKGGKLPGPCLTQTFVDYTKQCKALEIRKGVLQPGMQVILVDEWVETGAQMEAAIKLVESQGARVLHLVSLHVDENPKTRQLDSDYGFISLKSV